MSGRLEFRLLGPLEVARDGQLLRLGGERQRALLALLLIHANTIVGGDRLVDDLFGGERSESRVNALQVAISRLRRVLENGGAEGGTETLVTRSPGYLLRADGDQLDVNAFEGLFERGRRLLADGDPVGAAGTLRQALSLWRGPALADLALLDFVQPEVRRLEELRLAAVMERIDADLAVGASAEVVPELEALAAANPLQERLRGQLMLALYRSGRQADALAIYRQTREFLSDELGLEPSRALQELERSILRQEPELERPAPAAPAADAIDEDGVVCPFKGLAHYETGDAEYFFGRERVVADLVTRLAGGSLVGIIGPSGAGKSSLLRAGILPSLAAGALPGSEGWRVALMRPGDHPCAALAEIFDIDNSATLAILPPGVKLVLGVDQFEELFTTCESEDERARFLKSIVQLAGDPDRRVLVVVSVRADFYGNCAAYPRFAELMTRNHVLVGPMARDELARAIELPARRAGLQVERPLVDALVADVAGEPGGLPLLSTMLLELWRLREGRLLRLQTYQLTGGVRSAVARLAEDTYGTLNPEQQQMARMIMLRLTAGEIAGVTRRRLPLTTFDQLAGADRVLAALIDARLLTVSAGEVEMAHEALLHEWPRFRGWLEEDDAGRRLQAHLSESAEEWDRRGKDPTELYRGARLAATLEWASQHGAELTTIEQEFVSASRDEAERESRRQRRLNRRLRGLLLGTVALLVLAAGAGGLALVKQHDAQTASRTALARQLGAEALIAPRVDLSLLLAREAFTLDRSQQTEGTLLAALLRSPAAVGTITLPIAVRPQHIAVSPDGGTLAVSDNAATIRFYDTRTRALMRPPLANEGFGYPAVYTDDGSLLMAFDFGRRPLIDLFDAHTLRRLRSLPLDDRWANSQTSNTQLLFASPDDKTAYLAYNLVNQNGRDGPVFIDRWRIATGRFESSTEIGGQGLQAAALVQGGRRLILLTDDAAETLDAGTLRSISSVRLASAPADISTAAISPDGDTAAIGSRSDAVAFVDLRTGTIRNGVGGHSGAVESIAFSPDGRTVASAGDDARVILWNPATAQPSEVLSGHAGRVLSLAFSRDGRGLFSSALDGTVLEWDASGARRFGHPFQIPNVPTVPDQVTALVPLAAAPGGTSFAVRSGPSTVELLSTHTLRRQTSFTVNPRAAPITALAWTSRGVLAVGGQSGVVELWRVGTRPVLIRSLAGLARARGELEAIQALAFSPDGSLLAAVDADQAHGPGPPPIAGHLAIWRTGTGTLVAPPRTLAGPGGGLAFSPDGRELAVAPVGSAVTIADPRTGRTERTLGTDSVSTGAVAFSPDGTLLTGSNAGTVQRWRTTSARPLGHAVLVAAAPVATLAFAPGGQSFVSTGQSDGVAKLWSAGTSQQFGANFEGVPGGVGNAVFTPDGRSLIVIYDDGKGTVWPVSTAAWVRQACAVAGRNLTREEWARFVTGRAYNRVCA